MAIEELLARSMHTGLPPVAASAVGRWAAASEAPPAGESIGCASPAFPRAADPGGEGL